ncbi:MAG TPA: hypothetical protein VH762_15935 [Gemmatimonadaceae bacterium]
MDWIASQMPSKPGSGIDEHRLTIRQFVSKVCDLTGMTRDASTETDNGLTRTLVAATPFLRSQLLLYPADPKQSGSWFPIEVSQVPLALLSLYLFALSAQSAGMTRITFQTLAALESRFRPLLHTLVHTDSVMVWRKGVLIDGNGFEKPEQRLVYMRLAKALLPSVQRKRKATLGDLILEYSPSEPLERVLFIKRVSAKLLGKIGVLEREQFSRTKVGRRLHLASSVQRFALAHGGDTALRVATRRAR